jgi:excisionase family DNA binding protein
MDRLLTPEDVAEWLKVQLTTIYKYTSQKKIPFVKLSARAIRFSEPAIREWLQDRSFSVENPAATEVRNDNRRTSRKKTRVRNEDVELIIEGVKREVLGKQLGKQKG